MGARRVHALCRRRLDTIEPRLGPGAFDPRHARPHVVAGQPAVHEHGAAYVPCQALSTQREIGDVEF